MTLYEAADYFGGHTHTVDVRLPGRAGPLVTHGVDTGFLVFNHRTYPQLVQLFESLGVQTAPSDMSFSVRTAQGLEWSGATLNTVFAQRRNLFSPGFLGMLREVLRFNRVCTQWAQAQGTAAGHNEPVETVAAFLDRHGFSARFRRDYFLPMVGCIWSCPTAQMLAFPVGTMIRFCHNHGLLQVNDRPQWYTVAGGARQYVQRMLAALPDARLATPVQAVKRSVGGVQVYSRDGTEAFDAVVFACHSDQALALLGEGASPAERSVLGAVRYHPNRAVLHLDTTVLPRRQRAWAAWNYQQAASPAGESAGVCLHYLLNRLQPLPFAQPVIVSLNPVQAPRPETVLAEFDYAHPVFDRAAVLAQARLGELQGAQRSWFCGAWSGYGFHEDGLCSGMAVAQALQAGLVDEARQRLAA